MKQCLAVALVAVLAMSVACGDDEGQADDPDAAVEEPDANPGDMNVTINFAAVVGAQTAACGTTFTGLGTAASDVELLDLRFYVSNVRLLEGTTEVPVALDDTSNFQTGTVALLDFEDASGNCEGTAETNSAVTGTIASGTYDGIVFDLGVPFADNHGDVTAAETPLNIMSLYWAWLTGHKFVKIDVQEVGGGSPNRWNFHLGATNCDNSMAGPTVPPTMQCGRPNIATVSLSAFDPATDTINIDVGALLANSDLSTNTNMTPPGCQSFLRPDAQAMTDADCTEVFAAVGLDLDSGTCSNNCDDQTAFTVAQ